MESLKKAGEELYRADRGAKGTFQPMESVREKGWEEDCSVGFFSLDFSLIPRGRTHICVAIQLNPESPDCYPTRRELLCGRGCSSMALLRDAKWYEIARNPLWRGLAHLVSKRFLNWEISVQWCLFLSTVCPHIDCEHFC